jgi:hypothetical protein
MKTGPLDVPVARPLVCVITWRLSASLLDGLRWSSVGLVLCKLGYLDRCLVGGSTAGLPRGRRIAAGRLSLAAPGDRCNGCRASVAGGSPEEDRSMLTGSVYLLLLTLRRVLLKLWLNGRSSSH